MWADSNTGVLYLNHQVLRVCAQLKIYVYLNRAPLICEYHRLADEINHNLSDFAEISNAIMGLR